MEDPINRFVASKYKYKTSIWPSVTDNVDISVASGRRTSVDNLVHRQYVDFILSGASGGRTAIGSLPLLVVIPWFGKGCIGIHDDFTPVRISC